MTRIPSQTSEPPQSVSTSAAGIFRGILGNVGTTVVGGGGQSVSALEAKIRNLIEELGVVQEELESKITENEHLVMDNCETRREKREAEAALEGMQSEMLKL